MYVEGHFTTQNAPMPIILRITILKLIAFLIKIIFHRLRLVLFESQILIGV